MQMINSNFESHSQLFLISKTHDNVVLTFFFFFFMKVVLTSLCFFFFLAKQGGPYFLAS
jgi:hypothetical protein